MMHALLSQKQFLDQKKYFLPRIVKGEVTFALGYSEPSGGTDLGSLKTRAVEDEDLHIIGAHRRAVHGEFAKDIDLFQCFRRHRGEGQ